MLIDRQQTRPTRVVKLKCQRCGNVWTYEGKQQYFVTCGKCYTKVSIVKQKVEEDEITAVRKQEQKTGEGGEGIKLRCRRCNHIWIYTGKNLYWATCPECRNKVSIKSQRVN